MRRKPGRPGDRLREAPIGAIAFVSIDGVVRVFHNFLSQVVTSVCRVCLFRAGINVFQLLKRKSRLKPATTVQFF